MSAATLHSSSGEQRFISLSLSHRIQSRAGYYAHFLLIVSLNAVCSYLYRASLNGAHVNKISIGEFLFEAEAEPEQHWLRRLRKRRGMRAARRIAKGEVVLSVPINITFSAENAKQTDLRDVIETLKLDQYVSMALMLLQERSKGTASPYFPYVCKVRLCHVILIVPHVVLRNGADPRNLRDNNFLAI
jgi:hypothetical protein